MKKIILFLLAFTFLTGCQAAPAGEAVRDRSGVTVVMGPTSEPEAGFDPAFGWGAGEHVHEPLIQSTLTVTNPDLTIGYDLATSMEAGGRQVKTALLNGDPARLWLDRGDRGGGGHRGRKLGHGPLPAQGHPFPLVLPLQGGQAGGGKAVHQAV